MKNKLISKSLYNEGIHQIRTIAIVHSILSTALPLVSLIMSVAMSVFSHIYFIEPIKPEPIYFYDLCPTFFISTFIFIPIYVSKLFDFLHKRNESDFYLSLPYTRGSIIISFSMAIMTATVLSVALSTIVCTIAVLCLPSFFSLVSTSVFPYALNSIVAPFLMMSIMLIGYSVSGKKSTSFIVSLMIAFLPRILIFSLTITVYSFNTFLPINHANIFLNNNLNLISGFLPLSDILTPFGSISPKDSFIPLIYSFILAVIYFIAAYYLFNKRPSEMSQKASISSKIQGVTRIAFTMAFCIPAIIMIYNIFFGSAGIEWVIMLITVATVYFFAVLLYFLYELISTRNAKNLIKAIPSFLIVIALNIGIIGIMSGATVYARSFTPSTDEIKNINMLLTETQFDYLEFEDDDDNLEYFFKNASEITLNDEGSREILSECLKRSSNGRINFDKNVFNFKISTDNHTKYRTVSLKESEYQQLFNSIVKNAKNRLFVQLPDANKFLTVCDTSGFEVKDKAFAIKIYDSLKTELEKLDFISLYEYIVSGDAGNFCGNISTTAFIDAKQYDLSLEISSNYTPKTFQMMCEYQNSVTNADSMIKSYTDGSYFIDMEKDEDSEYTVSYWEDIFANDKALKILNNRLSEKRIKLEESVNDTVICIESDSEAKLFAKYLESVKDKPLDTTYGFVLTEKYIEHFDEFSAFETSNQVYYFPLDPYTFPIELFY